MTWFKDFLPWNRLLYFQTSTTLFRGDTGTVIATYWTFENFKPTGPSVIELAQSLLGWISSTCTHPREDIFCIVIVIIFSVSQFAEKMILCLKPMWGMWTLGIRMLWLTLHIGNMKHWEKMILCLIPMWAMWTLGIRMLWVTLHEALSCPRFSPNMRFSGKFIW